MGTLLGLLIGELAWTPIDKWAWKWPFRLLDSTTETLSTDYRDDPVYKKHVHRLIERNRQFEKKE
jgi:hypothetical protein